MNIVDCGPEIEQQGWRFRRISWGKWTLWTAKDILDRGTKLLVKGDEDDWFPSWRGHGSCWEIIGCWHLRRSASPLIGPPAPSLPLIGRDIQPGAQHRGARHGAPGVLGRAAVRDNAAEQWPVFRRPRRLWHRVIACAENPSFML